MKLFAIFVMAISTLNAEPFLTERESKDVSDYLSDVCGDTYCGGDVDFSGQQVTCDERVCVLTIGATSYIEDEPLISSVEAFNLLPRAKKKILGAEALFAENVYNENRDHEEVEIVSECFLALPYGNTRMDYDAREEAVYDATLDCVDKLTYLFYSWE